jgi:hypothetical protein
MKILSAFLDFIASGGQTTPRDTFRYERTNIPAHTYNATQVQSVWSEQTQS